MLCVCVGDVMDVVFSVCIVRPELDKAKLWHWMWHEAGKPQSGAVYEVMKRTKHQYHYAVHRCKRNKLVIQKEPLARNINKSREFWTELKKINPTSKVISSLIGSANGSTEITNLFDNKYRSLYSSVRTDDNELREIHDVINSRLPPSTHTTVTPDIIKQCIHKLKPGKDDGDLGFKSDHIINGSHRLHLLLSLLYTPTDLLKSSVISIPKDAKVSLSNIDNYRGIALFNCICKLYDNITLFLHGNYLNTSDMQFGYKKGHSTTMCTLIYKEIINQYINNGSDVYSCLLDASKAFDRVHYRKLFRILLSKKLPILIIKWILDSYLRQSVCVMWDSCKSEYFKMYNGVKQGVVISCHLFNLYIDPLLVQLSNSGYGCHIAGVYAGALSYADDITLLCPSVWGLNEMLKICNKYRLENNIIFNSKKTVCIKFGSTVIGGEVRVDR